MKRELYVFMDSVSQNFGEPFTLANFGELRREFQKLCENPAIPAYAIRDTIVVHLGTFSLILSILELSPFLFLLLV